MRAVVVTEAGGPEALTVQDRPDPVPGPGEAVVRMAAANINPTDLGARQGMYPPGFDIDGPPYVLGWDLAGEVTATGDGVDGVAAGDAVVGMIPWYAAGGRYGAYAELVLLEAQWLVPLPDGLAPAVAATVPLNALTAEQALAKLAPPGGAEILVVGASGAVGSFFVQLARAAGHPVTAVAGTGDEEWVRGLGATTVLARDTDLGEVGPFRAVLDAVPVGAAAFAATADGGVIVSTRPVEDEPGRGIDQRPMLIEADPPALARLVGRVASGELVSRISTTVPLAEAARAHALSEERGRQGKVVLVP